jgi:hypothetical protein
MEMHDEDGELKENQSESEGDGSAEQSAEADVAPVSRKVRRRGRRTRMRSKTIAPRRLTKEELRIGAMLSALPPVDRPQTRADCVDMPRPCPFVSCKHHLYLDVNPDTHSIKLNFPDLEVWEMTETCALDVADRGGATLEEVGAILNLTRERIRQVEVRGLLKLKTFAPGCEDELPSEPIMPMAAEETAAEPLSVEPEAAELEADEPLAAEAVESGPLEIEPLEDLDGMDDLTEGAFLAERALGNGLGLPK